MRLVPTVHAGVPVDCIEIQDHRDEETRRKVVNVLIGFDVVHVLRPVRGGVPV